MADGLSGRPPLQSDDWRRRGDRQRSRWARRRFPLAVLFGLNAADGLDRAGVLRSPACIRDHFGMIDAAALSLVGATAIAIALIELPLALPADRRKSRLLRRLSPLDHRLPRPGEKHADTWSRRCT